MIPKATHRHIAFVAVAAFCFGVTLTAYRIVRQYQTPGSRDPSTQGMCDFHNGIYFPTLAMLAGTSPYGSEYAAEYPVSRQIPFFSPGILVLHVPLALLPLHIADVIYFVITVLLVIACATLCASAAGVGGRIEWIASIAAVIVFSRSGHITLYNGYFTIELVLATMLAIHFAKDRPIFAALALAVVSAKPTYLLPLGLLLLARGNYRALIIGAVISLMAAGLPLAWLSYHEGIHATGSVDFPAGMSKIIDDVQGAQQVHLNQQEEMIEFSWTRLDLLAAVCKWTGNEPGQLAHIAVMAIILIWPMIILYRRMHDGIDDGVAGVTGCLIMVATLSSVYHQSYDALLVAAPVTGLIAARLDGWKQLAPATRLTLGLLMLFPTFHYLSTRNILSRLDLGESGFRVVTSAAGISLGIALVIICVLASPRKVEPTNERIF